MIEPRSWAMRLRAHEPLALRYRRLLEDGTTRELLGEVYALSVYDQDGNTVIGVGTAPMSAASTIERDVDGDFAEMILPPGTTALLAERVGLSWELAELLPNGERDPRFAGQLTVAIAASTVAGIASPTARGDVDMIIEREG